MTLLFFIQRDIQARGEGTLIYFFPFVIHVNDDKDLYVEGSNDKIFIPILI